MLFNQINGALYEIHSTQNVSIYRPYTILDSIRVLICLEH